MALIIVIISLLILPPGRSYILRGGTLSVHRHSKDRIPFIAYLCTFGNSLFYPITLPLNHMQPAKDGPSACKKLLIL